MSCAVGATMDMQTQAETESMANKLRSLHDGLRVDMPQITRVAVAVYDSKTDMLKTYVNSTFEGDSLPRHEAKLSSVPSLQHLVDTRADRIISDTAILKEIPTRHSQAVAAHWGSSFTRPLFENQNLRGFVFFDAREKDFFQPPVVLRLNVYAELTRLLLVSNLFAARMLHSAVEVASEVSHQRDPETGAHLDRMSHYSRLIARNIAPHFKLDDAFVEHILLFSPLHDIGKIAIPDSILLKPGRLTEAEMTVMRTHTIRGAEVVDRILSRLELTSAEHGTMVHNIIRHHHEWWDGSGYPDGLKAEAIPLEARIVTVADVYDALTSDRPYKRTWSMDEAVDYLQSNANRLFDARCVEALIEGKDAVAHIRQAFQESPDVAHEGFAVDL